MLLRLAGKCCMSPNQGSVDRTMTVRLNLMEHDNTVEFFGHRRFIETNSMETDNIPLGTAAIVNQTPWMRPYLMPADDFPESSESWVWMILDAY